METNYDELLKSLLADGAISAAALQDQPADFIDNFIKRERVQFLTGEFVSGICAEIQEAVREKEPVESGEGEKMSVKEEPAVSTIEEPALPASQPDAVQAPAETQTAPAPEPLPLVTELKPGEIPPSSTPPPVSQESGVEQMRTTFSISANGKVNVDFRGILAGKSANGKPVKVVDVTIPPELGLSFNADTSELQGVPLQSGEFALNINFQFDPSAQADPILTGICNFFVNPDPRTLWKNLESDRSDKYWKDDAATESVSAADGLIMVAASKRGRSHAHVGSFRDDDFSLSLSIETGWRIMTVADGAGSAKLSRKGSLIATTTATNSISAALAGERGEQLDKAIALRETDAASAQKMIQDELYYLFGNAAKESVLAIESEAKSVGAPYKDFSTTLIIAIHKKFTAGHFVAAYWVGDGGVAVYCQGRELKVLGKADSGEFAGQTRFLDSAMLTPLEISKRIDAKIVSDFTAIITMTDGVTDPKFETDANIENIAKWDELWGELSPLVNSSDPADGLLDWLDFWSPGNHDDRTIAILYPSADTTGQQPEKQEASL